MARDTEEQKKADQKRYLTQAALTRWAYEPDRTAATAPAREASEARFEKLVDPDGVLPPEERAKRAECARRAHFIAMGRASAAARKKTAEARKASA